MPKEESSFLYFLLEGHDNLSFYSTLPHKNGDLDRTMEIFSPIEFKDDLDRLWAHLGPILKLKVLKSEIFLDR
jgi:hypothetical protein